MSNITAPSFPIRFCPVERFRIPSRNAAFFAGLMGLCLAASGCGKTPPVEPADPASAERLRAEGVTIDSETTGEGPIDRASLPTRTPFTIAGTVHATRPEGESLRSATVSLLSADADDGVGYGAAMVESFETDGRFEATFDQGVAGVRRYQAVMHLLLPSESGGVTEESIDLGTFTITPVNAE